MLIESQADYIFSDAVQTIARHIERKSEKKQFVTKTLDIYNTVKYILDNGGYIDQIIKTDNLCQGIVLYTAGKEICKDS